jgi:NodT family efflux transporter outer membrane factor (OMF) lipoprotein
MVTQVRSIKSLLLLGCVTALSACASIPDLGARPQRIEATALAADQAFAAPRGDWPAADWWRSFGDPALDSLIDEALAGSPDVAQAGARLRAAEAAAQQAGAALLPSLSADASIYGNKQSKNLGIPPQFVPSGINDVGRVAGNLSFDLDIWGRNRAALKAATSEADAARVDVAQARLTLTAAVAAAYADLALYYEERDVAVDALAVRQTTADLTNQRVIQGLDTRGELRQAEARVPAAKADIAALDEAIALTRNRLAALLGKGPDRGLSIERPRFATPTLGLPDRLSLDLVGRRPDIVSARLRSEAMASRIKVARADFYPNINLTAVAGLNSLGLDNLFKGPSSFANFGPALTLPIFEGGRLQGAYRGARAQYDEAVAAYDATLVNALHEIADATASLRALDERLAEQRDALTKSEEASAIARLRYKGGLANQLTVLTTDDTMLANRRVVADLEGRRRALNITLIRALGGGFADPAPSLAGTR